MLTPTLRHGRALTRLALCVSSLAGGLSAQAGDFERGPAPTPGALEANGPFAIATASIAKPEGYGSATVYFPRDTSQGKFGLVVLTPGFLGVPSYYQWLAERVASHGFVVVNIGTNTIFDVPDARAREMAAALKQVASLAALPETPFGSATDTSRRALMGHSAGGGGTLTATLKDPSLKAAIPMNAATTGSDFSGITVPTMILACEKDAIAPNKTFSAKYYASLSANINHAYLEVAGADHLCPLSLAKNSVQNTVGKTVISWLKRYVDDDRRYEPFITGASAPTYSKVDVQIGR
ncbi:MAG: alpha/beta hydrolase [Aquabacterium sp.]|nr:alpha/beta hydrolase [Aquabacterium sp.]